MDLMAAIPRARGSMLGALRLDRLIVGVSQLWAGYFIACNLRGRDTMDLPVEMFFLTSGFALVFLTVSVLENMRDTQSADAESRNMALPLLALCLTLGMVSFEIAGLLALALGGLVFFMLSADFLWHGVIEPFAGLGAAVITGALGTLFVRGPLEEPGMMVWTAVVAIALTAFCAHMVRSSARESVTGSRIIPFVIALSAIFFVMLILMPLSNSGTVFILACLLNLGWLIFAMRSSYTVDSAKAVARYGMVLALLFDALLIYGTDQGSSGFFRSIGEASSFVAAAVLFAWLSPASEK